MPFRRNAIGGGVPNYWKIQKSFTGGCKKNLGAHLTIFSWKSAKFCVKHYFLAPSKNREDFQKTHFSKILGFLEKCKGPPYEVWKSASKFGKDFPQNFGEIFLIFKKIFRGVAGCADGKSSSSGFEKHIWFRPINFFGRVSVGSEFRILGWGGGQDGLAGGGWVGCRKFWIFAKFLYMLEMHGNYV